MPLYPVMVELGHVRFYRLVFLLVLAAAVYSVSASRRSLVVALALGVPTIAAQIVLYATPGRSTFMAATVLGLVFMIYVAVRVLVGVLQPGRVTADRIAGAISVYLLLGMVWALLYGLVSVLDPQSFRAPDYLGLAEIGRGAEYAFIYYSFVTLTTLGYGEIAPTSPLSQMLAWTEAVVGQLYLAILIARLVGLHIAGTGRPD